MANNLLCCPFCGGEAEHDSRHYIGQIQPNGIPICGHTIYCSNPMCIGQPMFSRVWSDDEGGFDAARTAWNTRPNASNELPADVLDEVRDALQKAADWFDEYADHHHRLAVAAGYHVGKERSQKSKRNKERADYLRTALAKLSAMPSGWLPMIAFAESLPERDDLRGEQVFLTFSDKTGTWNVETIEAGWDDDMTGLPLGNSHWLDITEMWPRSAHPTPPEGEK